VQEIEFWPWTEAAKSLSSTLRPVLSSAWQPRQSALPSFFGSAGGAGAAALTALAGAAFLGSGAALAEPARSSERARISRRMVARFPGVTKGGRHPKGGGF
jgi:hypothetical protein